MSNSIGEAIKKLRKINGFSQDELAEKLNIKRSTYAYREKNSSFTAKQLSQISEIFKISYDALLKGVISHPLNIPPDYTQTTQIFEQPHPEFKSEIEENFAVLTNLERRLLKKIRQLSSSEKISVGDFIDSIKSTEE